MDIASSPLEHRLAEIVGPTLQGMGFDLVRVQMQGGSGNRKVLQVMCERQGATGLQGQVSVDDCADISRALSAVLDVADPIDEAFVLEVSSPGLDRPLTRRADFDRFAGREVRLETAFTVAGRRRFKGVLKGLAQTDDGPMVALDADDGLAVSLPLESLIKAKLVITDAVIAEALKGEPDSDPASSSSD
ncbi:ribosome maturation factor RimP [Roseospirillum parvum]|uniref:Ribosome maturation factor RimP n=1 Tax=Roseospirillum parvum TaxID=83401 RepID=A0A1G8BYI1_9PROT|nr:ribosome maturation factor RimP [Roseospirillum parvum]SDH38184.1 ribosome maturation factor RimP [Roseospirillum parvum]